MSVTTDTSRVIIDTSQATPALARLNSALDKTAKSFGGIKSTLIGLGFAALARGAVLAADEIQDLADSSGIATARLKEFQAAMSQSGGNSNDLVKSVTTFTKSLDEAVQGSLAAQNSFAKLGVSLSDLRTLSEYDLMQKTLVGIDQFIPKGQQATEMMDKFGKSARTMSAGGMADELKKTAGEGDRVSVSIARAAKLNDDFAKALDTLRMAFLEAFSPAIAKINSFNEEAGKSKKTIDNLITAIKLVGIAISTSFVAGALTSAVTLFGSMGRGIGVIIGLLGGNATSKFVGKLFQATGAAAKLLPALRAISLIVSVGFGIYAATQLFDDFGNVASNVFARLIEEVGEFSATILNIPSELLASVFNLFGAEIKDPWGLGTPIQMLVDKAKAARLEFEKTHAAAKKTVTPTDTATDVTGSSPTAIIDRPVDTTQADNARRAVEDMANAYKEANDRIREQIDLDNSLIGVSKSYADSMRAQSELNRRTNEEIEQLTEAKAKMSKDDKENGLGKVYDQQIERVRQLHEEESSRLADSVELTEKLTAAENLRLYGITQQLDVNKQVRQIQDETAKLTMTEIEKKYYDIAAAARESAKAAIEAEESRRNEKMSTEEAQKYYDAAEAGVNQVTAATKKQWEMSRTFDTGWKQAWNDYADNANNAAEQAKKIFNSLADAFESVFDKLIRNQKINWKEMLTDMIAQAAKSDIQKLFASASSSSSGTGGFLQSIGKFFSGGFATGGIIPAGGYGITGENGPEYVNGPATITPMQAGGGDTYHVTINANDSKSFVQMMSEHPEVIYGLNLKGQRSVGG